MNTFILKQMRITSTDRKMEKSRDVLSASIQQHYAQEALKCIYINSDGGNGIQRSKGRPNGMRRPCMERYQGLLQYGRSLPFGNRLEIYSLDKKKNQLYD